MRQGRAESPTGAFSPGQHPGVAHAAMGGALKGQKHGRTDEAFSSTTESEGLLPLQGERDMNLLKPRALPWAESNNWAFSPPIP